jgi:NAD(P)H-quinone oxidoreductase subunit 5
MSHSVSEASLRETQRPIAKFWVRFMWSLFLVSLAFLFYTTTSWNQPWTWQGILHVDGLTTVMWSAVTLFTGIVLSYASRYLAGSEKLPQFMLNGASFAASVMLLVAADHVVLFALAWLSMGLLMARLIGGYTDYQEGKASQRNARKYFLRSTFFMTAGLIGLVYLTHEWSLTGILQSEALQDGMIAKTVAICLIVAATIQAALFPFQRWLMGSMTAPTPASALMHAGFVNAGAILLTRTAPLLFTTELLWILVIVGGIGALVGKLSKFIQPGIKQKLACSTTAQMGFMLLQCGLGYFSAAVTHLILHGMYKAYLFLSSGDSIAARSPHSNINRKFRMWHLPIILISGLAGGYLFALLTGKGTEWNSGLFLVFVIVATVIHGTQDALRRSDLSGFARLIAIPLLVIPALTVYGLIFGGIHHVMADVPFAEAPTALSYVQIGIGILYLITFVIIELQLYKKSKWLYVRLLNISQPYPRTILN